MPNSGAEKFEFDQVDILLIDPDRGVRSLLRNILMDQGFRHVSVGADMDAIKETFRINVPDLLITDIRPANGDLKAFIHGLRHNELGANPFLPVIITAWSPTNEDVHTIIQSGADDLITKPLSATQLLRRIKSLVKARKPFVVTSGYIGPDRRKLGRDHDRGMKIDPIDVPNTLRAKVLSGHHQDIQNLQAEIDACIRKVNLEKLNRHAYQVEWLVERIVPGLAEGAPNEETINDLKRLLYVGQDITRRMVGTKFEHVGDLCTSLTGVTKRILSTLDSISHKDLDLLAPLAQSIKRGFDDSDEGSTRAAREISSTLSSKSRGA